MRFPIMLPERRPNPDESPETLEARLRALPAPAVPPSLEARLLASIPPARPIPRRRWPIWAGLASALAAACLLAVLAWRGHIAKSPGPGPEKNEFTHQETPQLPDVAASLAAWRESQRVLDGEELPPFTWPLDEPSPLTVSTSIPSDLLH
jgi:hypothetical protein